MAESDNIFANEELGISVSGDTAPVEIKENIVKNSGLAGIKVVGKGHGLKKNQSGGKGAQDNQGCDYELDEGNLDQGENQSDGSTLALTIPGCAGSPCNDE